MSTFDGHVKEFPEIRIDRFRQEKGARPALAYFLSHVHTDHLVGLEGNRGVFVYCSSATREILLRLEKYPHRMNFAKGILESRKRTYKDLDRLLRPIPLETPTEIQLGYKRFIRVTLFDANHCTGSSMFLIEGDGKAVLYTGDVRSELWWVNTLLRNPVLLPYVASTDEAPLKRLDNVYLDTTFANRSDRYQEFPTKASGLMELLRKVSQYPDDTLFYFDAWTFGYEEVWQSLSAHLGSQIHVDNYRSKVYQSLLKGKEAQSSDATKLNGACIGNDERKGGCLTTKQCRIHSCEKGTGCEIWSKQFVRLTPIISRHKGIDMQELGAGGGHGDLNQKHELDLSDADACSRLFHLCYSELKDQPQLRDGVVEMLRAAMENTPRTITLELADLNAGNGKPFQKEGDHEDLPLVQAVHALAKHVARTKQSTSPRPSTAGAGNGLPKQITFPYSRHSSYTELCLLIEAFKPKDITPCTVDEQNWTAHRSMTHLFGHIYDTPMLFSHDQEMFSRHAKEEAENDDDEPPQTQYEQLSQTPPRETQQSDFDVLTSPPTARSNRRRSSQHRSGDEEREKSPKRRRVSEGDFWRPTPTDHYSPPGDRTSRNVRRDHYSPPRRRKSGQDNRPPVPTKARTASITSHTSSGIRKSIETPQTNQSVLTEESWSQPSIVQDRPVSPSRQINRWQKRIAQSRQMTDPFQPNSKGALPRQPSNYGRLSPPALDREDSTTTVRSSERPRSNLPSRAPSRRRQSLEYGRLSPPPALTASNSEDEDWDENELKLGLQWEAHNAAMGVGQDWSVMSLVSVQNHQAKEEEL